MIDTPAFEIVRAYTLTQLYGDAIIPKHGVATYEFHLLYRLHGEAPVTQAELGRRLLRDPMNVSRLVRSLEGRQLLRRTTSAADSRANLVALTSQGEALVARVLAALADADPLRGWSKSDVRMFTALLQRACDSISAACLRAGIKPQRTENPDRRKKERSSDEHLTPRSAEPAEPQRAEPRGDGASVRRRVARSDAKKPLSGRAKRGRR